MYPRRIGDNDALKALCKHHKRIKFHLSAETISELKNVVQTNTTFKPLGLWYGIGCAWIDFIINGLGEDPCCFIYQVITNDDHIKKISSMQEMTSFSHETIDGQKIKRKYIPFAEIDWSVVARKYNGIEIDVTKDQWYHSSHKSLNEWFATWDIPSGVIWKFADVILWPVFYKRKDIWYQLNDIKSHVKYEFTRRKK